LRLAFFIYSYKTPSFIIYSLVGIVDAKLSYQVIQLGFFYSAKHSECPKLQKRRKMSVLQLHRSLEQVAENIMSNYLPAVYICMLPQKAKQYIEASKLVL